MSTPDSDGDRPAKRLGRKLREASISAGYRSQRLWWQSRSFTRCSASRASSVALSGGTGGRS